MHLPYFTSPYHRQHMFILQKVYVHASTVSCTCMVSCCRMGRMPCTALQTVGTLRSSSSCCLCLEQGSMRRITMPKPCCTVQPRMVTVRWHATSLKKYTWTHRTGTRCVGFQGTVLVSVYTEIQLVITSS